MSVIANLYTATFNKPWEEELRIERRNNDGRSEQKTRNSGKN
jgi:hypothetical protein